MLRLPDEFRSGLDSAVEKFHMGITPVTVSYLLGRGVSREAMVEYKLGTVTAEVTGYSDYLDMVSIPYLTLRGGTCSLKVRFAHECDPWHEHPKYLQAAGESRLFNTKALDRADELGFVGICEGELDAIILTHGCGIPTVGVPGADTWNQHKEWPRLFRGYSRVLIFKDNDQPDGNGKKPGDVLARRIAHDIDTAQIIDLGYKDPTVAYMEAGSDAIRKIAGV